MPTKVAYLGPEGTYAQKAAEFLAELENLKEPIFIPFKGLRSVIDNVAHENCDAAVVPIENSVEGGVTTTLDALWINPNLFICRAIVLPIRHALFSNGSLTEISEVLSHPQALAQCSEWLSKNIPNAFLLPTNSTSEAMKMVVGSKFRAAIGSQSSIQSKRLNKIAYPINDIEGNCTRFILLKTKEIEKESNFISFAFSLKSNSPGALLNALNCIAKLGFNMSRIESRPSKRELGEYIFFVDVEMNEKNKKFKIELLKSMKEFCKNFVFFGSYPNSTIESNI